MKHIFSWLNTKLKTDVQYLAKNGFWLTLGQGFRMASGLILLVAFTNLLPKESYGTYQFVMAAAGILGAFTLSGMGSAVTRATAQGHEGAFRYGFKIKLIWSTGIPIAAGAISLYYFLNDNTGLAMSFLIVGAFSPFLESFRLYRFYLRGKQLFRESELLGFLRQLIPVVVILIALFLTKDPVHLLAVYFASHTFAVGLVYFQVIHKYKPPIEKNLGMLNLSKHSSFLNIIGMIASNLDKLLIFHFLGAVPTAAYVLAQTPTVHIRKVLAILIEMTIPKLSKRDLAVLQKTLPRKALMFFFIILAVVAAYILAAPFLFSMFFPAYPESILLTQVMALVLLFYPRSIFSQSLVAHGLIREIYFSRLNISILRAVLLLALLPLYGIWGAVFATLISHSIAFLFTWYLFAHAKVSTGIAN